MLQRANKPANRKEIEEFKRGADASPLPLEVSEPTHKLTQFVKFGNWAYLKKLSARLSADGSKTTMNMLLDEAIEMLAGKYGD